ncbi:hypothetical protein REPUB_Repub04eG0028100 [Reevesia pubescens]
MEVDSVDDSHLSGGEDIFSKERGAKRDRSALEDITNIIPNVSTSPNLEKPVTKVGAKESYRSKLMCSMESEFEQQLEEGEIPGESYDFDDDRLTDENEGPFILVRQLWSLLGDFQAVDLDNDYYCFRFKNEQDYNHVLIGEATIDSVVAWVRFPGMPLEFYGNDILLKIGNAIGKTLMVDRNTMVASRGKYARICMEVNLTKPLVPKIFTEGRWQSVEYERLGMVCFNCGKFGHSKEQCPLNHAIEIVKHNRKAMSSDAHKEANETGDESSKYGLWMIATKNYRKPRHEASPNPKQKQNFRSPNDASSEKQSVGSRFTILNKTITEQEDTEVSPTTKNKFINSKIWLKAK